MFVGSTSISVIRGSRSRCLNQPRVVAPLIQKDPSFCSNQTGTISTEPSFRVVPMIVGKTSAVKSSIFLVIGTAIVHRLQSAFASHYRQKGQGTSFRDR